MSKIPDALMVPPAFKTGATQLDRINSVLAVAEPLLGVDRDAGERGYIRRQPGEVMFVTKDPFDTLDNPVGSESAGSPRYRWEPARHDGIRLGYALARSTDAADAA